MLSRDRPFSGLLLDGAALNPPQSVLRRLGMGLVAAVLFLGLAEGVLRVAEGILGADWTVVPLPVPPRLNVVCEQDGLSYLCPDQGESYERVRFEVFSAKPPRPRIITIGESFVYGLGIKSEEAWPHQLEVALDGRAEVLNFGRCGTYASLLVPIVEAGLKLSPQIMILAIGNNEHTMTSFYTGLAGRSPAATYRMSSRLGQMRLYGGLYSLLGRQGRATESFDQPATSLTNEVDKQIYATRRRPPDLSVFGKVPLAGPEVTAAIEEEQQLKEMIFRDRITQMVETIQAAGVIPVLVTLPWDLRNPPTLSGIYEGQEEEARSLYTAVTSGKLEDRVLMHVVEQYPRTAMFQYTWGMSQLKQGSPESAVKSLTQATEWDLIPDVTPALNQITREVAWSHAVHLIEVERLGAAQLTPGTRIFLDKVHMNPEGSRVVANIMAPDVRQLLEGLGIPKG